MATSKKFIPGCEATSEEIFTYPFFTYEETKEFLKTHGRIMFIIRGPPGTGKFSLSELFSNHFPMSVRCSADDYFTKTFNPKVRNQESLKQSHEYCHNRVLQECTKNSHPVVVSNTHMRKREFQEYLNLAEEHGYTVIICSTLDKFEVSPEILEKSNTKGLGKEYFKSRLRQWEKVFPLLMGWFVCPDDSSYILHQLQYALDALLGDGKFCRVFNVFDKDTLLDNYKAKTLLCCMAGFINCSPFELKDYYESDKVRDSYGKCFTITIQAFYVTKNNIFAIVQLDNSLMNLTFKPSFKKMDDSVEEDDGVHDIVNRIRGVSVTNSVYKFKLTPLLNDFSKEPKFAMLKERCDSLNTNKVSFIHLAQNGENSLSMHDLNKCFRKNLNGELSDDQFITLVDGYKIYRVNDDGWVIQIPKLLTVKTVFTGLYI